MKLLLTSALLFSVVVFCVSANGQPEAQPKITIYHYHWTETVYDKLNEQAVSSFEAKHPNVTVKLLLVPGPDLEAKVRTALAANGNIDSFAMPNGSSASFESANQVVPIDPAAFGKQTVQQVVNMWTPGAFHATGGYWKGHYYGIPFELSNYVAWVNTADMSAAGLSPSSDLPKTWAAFVDVGSKLAVDKNGIRVRNGFENDSKKAVTNFLVLSAMMQQLGLDWGTEEGFRKSMGQTNVLVDGLRTYTDFVVKSRIWNPGLNENDREGFGDNKTAMFLTGGSWYWGVLDTYSVPRKDVRPFPYPRFASGKDIGGPGYGYALYVTRLSKHPKIAWEWLDSMASQPNAFIKLGYHQPRATLSDGQQALDPALAAKYIPYWAQVFEPELRKTAIWISSTKGAQIQDAVWQSISRVIYQNESAQQSVAELQAAVKSIFG